MESRAGLRVIIQAALALAAAGCTYDFNRDASGFDAGTDVGPDLGPDAKPDAPRIDAPPSCCKPPRTVTLSITGGELNTTTLSASSKTVTVAPGGKLKGTIESRLSRYDACPSCVFTYGATPNWGQHSTSYVCAGTAGGNSVTTRSITIDATAPGIRGTYYIIWAGRLQIGCDAIFSCTDYLQAPKWNDGNDIAEFKWWQIQEAQTSGTACASWYAGTTYLQACIPAAAVTVVVK